MKYLLLLVLFGCASPKYNVGECFSNKLDGSTRKVLRVHHFVYYYTIDKTGNVYTMRHSSFEKLNVPVKCLE